MSLPTLPDPAPDLAEFRARLDAYLAAGRKHRGDEDRQRKLVDTLLADLKALGCDPEDEETVELEPVPQPA